MSDPAVTRSPDPEHLASSPASPAGNRGRLRDFLAISALAMLCISALVGVGLNRVLQRMVLHEARQLSINVCQALADLELQRYIQAPGDQPPRLTITAQDIPSLDRRMRSFLSHFEIVKIKIFDPQSTILFSTDLRIIGRQDPDNPSLTQALHGRESSQLEHDDNVWELPDESRAGVDVVETYVPLHGPAGQVIGVIEVDLDVTSTRHEARSTLILAIAIVAAVLTAAFTLLSILMFKADRTIRATEHSLRREETRLRAILDRAADGIVLCDHQLAIVSLNPAATSLFGYEEQDLRGQHLSTLLASDGDCDEDRSSHPLDPALTLTSQPSLDCQGRRADRSLFPMRLLTTTIGVGDHAIVAAIMHDLTLTRQLHDQQRSRDLERAQHMNHIVQLATGVAHELRNPLTSIKLLVQQQRETLDVPNELAEDLAIIEDEILRMERSLQTFLDFARPAAPVYAPVNLLDVLKTVRALIDGRLRRQHVIFQAPDPSDPSGPSQTPDSPDIDLNGHTGHTVLADSDQIRQVLLNLFLNALDMMPDGGQLTVHLHRDKQNVLLHVTDSGPGIAPNISDRLFEPFTTTKETGIGLGLVVSRRIAREHGGDLTALDSSHKSHTTNTSGACFVLRLPAIHDHNNHTDHNTNHANHANHANNHTDHAGHTDLPGTSFDATATR